MPKKERDQIYKAVTNCSKYLTGREANNAVEALAPIADALQKLSINESESSQDDIEEEIKETILDEVRKMPLDQRDKVCEAFHFLPEQFNKAPKTRDNLLIELSEEMGLICDGISPDWLQKLEKLADEKLTSYVDELLAHSNSPSFKNNVFTVAILRITHEMSKELGIDSKKEFINAFPFLIRHVAKHCHENIDVKWLMKPEQKSIEVDKLLKIAHDFYPRAKDTLEKWKALKSDTPIGKMPSEASHTLIIDGKDVLTIQTGGGSLSESPLQIFSYDNEPAYANGVVSYWEHVMKLASSGKEMTSSDFKEIYSIIHEKKYKTFSFRTDQVTYGLPPSPLVTQDNLNERMAFSAEVKALQIDNSPIISLNVERAGRLSRLTETPDVNTKGLIYSSGNTNPQALDAVIDHLLKGFYSHLKNIKAIDELSSAVSETCKHLEWLHAGPDANGRACSQATRNVLWMQGLKQLGLQQSVIASFDPYRAVYKSKEELPKIIESDKAFSKGEKSLSQIAYQDHSPELSDEQRHAVEKKVLDKDEAELFRADKDILLSHYPSGASFEKWDGKKKINTKEKLVITDNAVYFPLAQKAGQPAHLQAVTPWQLKQSGNAQKLHTDSGLIVEAYVGRSLHR